MTFVTYGLMLTGMLLCCVSHRREYGIDRGKLKLGNGAEAWVSRQDERDTIVHLDCTEEREEPVILECRR